MLPGMAVFLLLLLSLPGARAPGDSLASLRDCMVWTFPPPGPMPAMLGVSRQPPAEVDPGRVAAPTATLADRVILVRIPTTAPAGPDFDPNVDLPLGSHVLLLDPSPPADASGPITNLTPGFAAAGRPDLSFDGDPQRSKKLLDHIFDRLGYSSLALLRTPGRTGQMHLDVWARQAQDRKSIRVVDISYDPQTGDPGRALEAIRRSGAEAVLTWSDAELAAGILRQMCQAGMTQLFVGSEHLVTDGFVKLVGCDPGRVIALWDCSARSDETAVARFAESYEALFKRPPKPAALGSYAAAGHLLRAINIAGLEREAIRRTLADMSNAFMARLEDGRWEFGAASDR